MKRFFELIILWLLITALPVQAIATVSMGLCDHGTQLNPIIQTSSIHVSLNAEESEHQHHRHAHNLEFNSESSDSSHISSGHHSADHGQCKAGCCTASLITATAVASPPAKITAGLRFSPLEKQLFSRFIPDGLERPPRHFQI